MINIYIDDSIHDPCGFMLLSFVSCKHDPQADLQNILSTYGLDEYHSCVKMKNNSLMREIRSLMIDYINNKSQWGIFILPNGIRHNIFDEFLSLVSRLRHIFQNKQLNFYIDQGIINNKEANFISSKYPRTTIKICDSSKINGIQLADLVAALCGVRLREAILGSPKILTYGEESGFNPPIQAELGFELWASLRYSMHKSHKNPNDDDIMTFFTKNHGFFLSEQVSDAIQEKSNQIFGKIYLGCIH